MQGFQIKIKVSRYQNVPFKTKYIRLIVNLALSLLYAKHLKQIKLLRLNDAKITELRQKTEHYNN